MPKPTVASLSEKVAELDSKVAELSERLDKSAEAYKEIRTTLENLRATAPAPRHRNARKPRTLLPCDATANCAGHAQESHIDIHRAQVAKKAAKA